MAGHEFSIYQYDPADPATRLFESAVLPDYWIAATQRLRLVATLGNGAFPFVLENLTFGGSYEQTGLTGTLFLTPSIFTTQGNIRYTFTDSFDNGGDAYGLLFYPPSSSVPFAFPETGRSGEFRAYGISGLFNVWSDTGIPVSTYSTTGTGILVNLTKNLYKLDAENAVWLSLAGYTIPTMPIVVNVGVGSSGQPFTLHTEGGSAQSLVASGSGEITGPVGLLEEFWVTRNSDGAISPVAVAMTGAVTQNWAVYFTTQPQHWVMTPFLIGEEIASHPIKVVHTSGAIQWLEPDPALPVPDTVSTTISGVTKFYQIYHFRAPVNALDGWSLYDASNNQYLGSFTTTSTKGLDEWLPPSPVGQITVTIPTSRVGTDFVLRDAVGNETAWVSNGGTGFWNYTFGSATTQVHFKHGTVAKVGPGPFKIVDKLTGSEQATSGTSSVDLKMWSIPEPITFTIPASRWTHDLWLGSPSAGRAERITPATMQGLWTFSEAGDLSATFTPFSVFVAASTAYGNAPWKIIDMTTSEVAPINPNSPTDLSGWSTPTDTQDSDGDGLYDWYEFLVGTKANVADTDGDGANDGAELAAGTNPRAQSLPATAASSLQILTPLE